MVLDIAIGSDATRGLQAGVSTFLRDTGFGEGTVIINQTLIFEALPVRVSNPPCWTLADSSVKLGLTFRIGSTGVRGRSAWVFAVPVKTSLSVGTVRVIFALSSVGWFTPNKGISGHARRTLTGGFVVLGSTSRQLRTRVFLYTGIDTLSVATGLSAWTLVIRRAARDNWFSDAVTTNIALSTKSLNASTSHGSPWKRVIDLTDGILHARIDMGAWVFAVAVETSLLAVAVGIIDASFVNHWFWNSDASSDKRIAGEPISTGTVPPVVTGTAIGILCTIAGIYTLLISTGQMIRTVRIA
jgi:hypothetical protein